MVSFYADPISGVLLAILTGVINIPLIRSSSEVLVFVNPCGQAGQSDIHEALLQLPTVTRLRCCGCSNCLLCTW
jgi:Co/Zn/Cd efflux system component